MWVGDANPVAAATFGAWGRVAETAPAEPTTPPIAPPASSVLTVGGEATVQTTEGEVLNLRSGAGRDFGLLTTVRNGTVVTLLEGPTDAGGFLWWRVRLPDGTEGWVVESADGIETLVPR
ncbi:MAG: SH3 domain-containing protein [Anaerolineae bacterium]|nr:SH3 domain-containing protein [Anaerolineae bacterium]